MEKTLLQQIREKEQDVAKKIDDVRAGADATIAAAKTDAENLLCTANAEGKIASEELYWREKGQTEAQAEQLRHDAKREAEATSERGKRNIPMAAAAIVRFVTME
ncbi:MAG: V-type ATPase subunit subunit G family protein [Methanoregula sp.]|nr:V-type ATPase subunit subunit G family protein [Methanoregula sp.]